MSVIYVEYWDKDKNSTEDRLVSGYFELVSKSDSHLTIRSKTNEITIPMRKIEKIKEKIKSE